MTGCWRFPSRAVDPAAPRAEDLMHEWATQEWARRQGIIERLCEMVWEASDPEYRDRLELIYPDPLGSEWMPVAASRWRR